MKLIFMGSSDFAVASLEALLTTEHQIAAVYTQPSRPAGRGKAPRPTPVGKRAESAGLEVRTPISLRDIDTFAELAAFEPEAIIVVAYGLLLPPKVLDLPKLKAWNVHASLLPRWRGAAPIHRSILAGDSATGVGIMQMRPGLDEGPLLLEKRVTLNGDETTGSLHDHLAGLGAEALLESLLMIEKGNPLLHAQSLEGITYAKKISKAEAKIDWQKSATEIKTQVRAFNPFPGAWTLGPDGRRLKILRAEVRTCQDSLRKPGEILVDSLWISCGEDCLELTEVQPEGKKAILAADYWRGYPPKAGYRMG